MAVADDDEEEAAALDAARSARREIGEEGDGASMTIDAVCIVDSLNSRLLIVPVERNAAAARRIMLFFFRGERERERERAQKSGTRKSFAWKLSSRTKRVLSLFSTSTSSTFSSIKNLLDAQGVNSKPTTEIERKHLRTKLY